MQTQQHRQCLYKNNVKVHVVVKFALQFWLHDINNDDNNVQPIHHISLTATK